MKERSTKLFKARSADLFKCFLAELKCSNIQNSIFNNRDNEQLLCSFETNSNPEELLKTIRNFFPLSQSYQKGKQFVISVPTEHLLKLTIKYYEDLFYELMGTNKFKYLHYQFDGEKFNLREEKSYKTLCRDENYQLMLNSGLCVRYEHEYIRSDLMNTFPPRYDLKQYWYIEINSPKLFAQNTIFKDLKKFQQFENEREQRKAFLMGTHAKLGAESKVLTYSKDTIFEKKNIEMIFNYFQDPIKKAPALKKILGYHHTAFPADEKINNDQDSHSLKKIKAHIAKLTKQISSAFPYPDLDSKKDKVEFLQLILVIHDFSPTFSLKQCLQCAKEITPALFVKAQAGTLSSTTKKILDEISSDVESPQQRSKPQKP